MNWASRRWRTGATCRICTRAILHLMGLDRTRLAYFHSGLNQRLTGVLDRRRHPRSPRVNDARCRAKAEGRRQWYGRFQLFARAPNEDGDLGVRREAERHAALLNANPEPKRRNRRGGWACSRARSAIRCEWPSSVAET
jgi:hypothetical protein